MTKEKMTLATTVELHNQRRKTMTKEKMTLATMVELHNQLVSSHNELVEEVKGLRAKVEELENRKQSSGVRNRGPLSTREMKDEDAERIMLGDLKDESHTKCAEVLGDRKSVV